MAFSWFSLSLVLPGNKDLEDEHAGVRGAGSDVHPPAVGYLPRRAQDIPVLQRAHQPGGCRTGILYLPVLLLVQYWRWCMFCITFSSPPFFSAPFSSDFFLF